MRRLTVMLTVGAAFAAFMAISALPAIGEPGGKSCTDNPNGCKEEPTGSTSTVGSTVEKSTKDAGASPGFNTTSTVSSSIGTTSSVKQRGNIGAGTEPTSTQEVDATTTTIEGPCTNPGSQPHGGPCK
jgi:hypothetical protein